MTEYEFHVVDDEPDAGWVKKVASDATGCVQSWNLQGVLHEYQSLEFSLRAQVQSAHEVIASATAVNAALLRREGELGVIAAGALADILVVDGNPLKDLGLLQGQGAHLSAIMQGGRFHKNRLV